jgi:hypothetical protein
VARTLINIKVKGTRQSPKVELSSDAGYSQQQLLLMLATGQRLSLGDDTSGRSRMTPALASDFVDYLLFGGERGRFIRALGLSDISINANEKRQGFIPATDFPGGEPLQKSGVPAANAWGVTFNKDVTDRLGVGYGVEMGDNPSSRQQDVTHRLEGEYQLTDKFVLGAQKEMKPARVGGSSGSQNASAAGEPLSSYDIPDDRVFLKFRSSF